MVQPRHQNAGQKLWHFDSTLPSGKPQPVSLKCLPATQLIRLQLPPALCCPCRFHRQSRSGSIKDALQRVPKVSTSYCHLPMTLSRGALEQQSQQRPQIDPIKVFCPFHVSATARISHFLCEICNVCSDIVSIRR